MQTIVQHILAFFARKIIAKYRPIVVGITGSVGKTSTKEAVYQVLNQKFLAYRPLKNFNNEFGFPFAIIGVDSPGRNVWKWFRLFARAKSLWLFPRSYPKVLVLEYGVDKPGDMDYLLSIAKPHVSVITNIGISHYEFFESSEAIEQEKGKLAAILHTNDFLVVNADNQASFAQTAKTQARHISYGLNQSAMVSAEVQESVGSKSFTTMKIQTENKSYEVRVNALGNPHIYAALAACAVGEALGVEPSLIRDGLELYKPAPGRLQIIAGIKQSLIIDDSYNASPDSTREALELLARLPAGYKMAVLGDMRELGSLTDAQHTEIGELVARLGIHRLVTVGVDGKKIAEAAQAAGFPESKISSWENSETAKKVVQQQMEPQSLVLVKGSQYVRMEKITKEIMAEPMRADELLCRQNPEWLAK